MSGAMKKYLAELIGTATLVLFGCGSAVIAEMGGALPLGALPIAFGFGLGLMLAAYAIGPISGCHINPAVTVGMFVAGRIGSSEAVGYIVAQFIGAFLGALVLLIILSGKVGGYDGGLGQNGWGADYLGGYGLAAAMLTEFVATFLFVSVILGATQANGGAGALAGLVIGLSLVVIHITFIQVTGVSVNPARSFGPAVLVGGQAIAQLWMFLLVPTIGGAVAGYLFRARVLSAD